MIKLMASRFEDWCEFFWLIAYAVATIMLVCWTVQAQEVPKLCRSPYFLDHPKFDYPAYKKSMEGVGPHTLVWLWNTANREPINSRKELQSNPNISGVEVILANENCTKPQYGAHGRCGPYELLAGMNTNEFAKKIRQDDAQLKAATQTEANRMCSFVNSTLPTDKVKLLNPLLESGLSRDEYTKFANWIKEVPACSDWTFVWNPIGGNPGLPQAPATVSEGHGPNPNFKNNQCIANLDGSAPNDGDYVAYVQTYGHLCLYGGCMWGANDNCINDGQSGFIDPRKRDCSDKKDFKVLGNALRKGQLPIEVPPAWSSDDDLSLANCVGTYNSLDGDGGFIWKQSHVAEYNGAVLFPGRFPRFKEVVVQKAGKKIGKIVYAPGVGFPDQAHHNVKRPIYRTNKDLTKYPFNVVVRGKLEKDAYETTKTKKGKVVKKLVAKKGVHCWRMINPRVRND